MVGDSNDGANFPQKLLSIDTQVSMIHKAFANRSSANIKLVRRISWSFIIYVTFVTSRRNNEKNRRKLSQNKVNIISILDKGITELVQLKICYQSLNLVNKLPSVTGSGITLIKNEIKDIVKVISFLEFWVH